MCVQCFDEHGNPIGSPKIVQLTNPNLGCRPVGMFLGHVTPILLREVMLQGVCVHDDPYCGQALRSAHASLIEPNYTQCVKALHTYIRPSQQHRSRRKDTLQSPAKMIFDRLPHVQYAASCLGYHIP